MDLRFYLSLFLGRLHWFLLVVVIGSAAGLTLARILPTVYLAQARLVVESEQIPDELAASTVQTQATEQLQIIQQRILTRDTLIEMANRLQIYGATGAGQGRSADGIVEDLRARISIVTTGGAVPRGPVQATLVSVGFEAPTAALAAAVTNELVTLILREDISMRTGAARQTLEFFEQELTRLDQELARRGAAILQFKEANQNALPDSLDFRRSQQASAQERLLQMDREEAALRDRRDRMVRLHEATGETEDATPARQQTVEQQQLRALRDDLARQRAVLSPENPRLKLLETQAAALENIVASQLAGGNIDAEGQRLSTHQVQLAEIDGQLAFIADQRRLIATEMEMLQTTIAATPGNAITLQTLERDYANVRAQYDQAAANKARAETGDMIEALAKGQRISVIEQAVAPRAPIRPNRPLIAAAGIGGGVVLGAGLVLLIEVLKAGIRRPVELTARLGITPFVTLPYMTTRAEAHRRRMIRAVIVFAVLAAIAATVLAVQLWYMPLDLLFKGLVDRLN